MVPTGHGTTVVGLDRGFRELAAAGVIEQVPRLYAAQVAGCAPLASDAPVEHSDTVCGPLEVPDPAGRRYALAALEELELSIGPDETVVVIDPASVDREADLLRSYLMSKGI